MFFMEYPTLDEATREAIDALTLEEVDRSVLDLYHERYGNDDEERIRRLCTEANSGYSHEILWYGVEAIAHVHLMRMALDISEGRLSVDDFVSKYSLDFDGALSGIFVPLRKIELDGVYIPQPAYAERWHGGEPSEKKRPVCLFNGDYHNRIGYDYTPVETDHWGPDKQYARQLISRKWQPSDLENQVLMEQGVRFGRDLWRTCVAGFEWHCKYRHEGWGWKESHQAQRVTDLGRKLIAYYDGIVNVPNP